MNFPKEIMSVTELSKLGMSATWLRDIYAQEGYPIAYKMSGGKTSKIFFDTKELAKYIRRQNIIRA